MCYLSKTCIDTSTSLIYLILTELAINSTTNKEERGVIFTSLRPMLIPQPLLPDSSDIDWIKAFRSTTNNEHALLVLFAQI